MRQDGQLLCAYYKFYSFVSSCRIAPSVQSPCLVHLSDNILHIHMLDLVPNPVRDTISLSNNNNTNYNTLLYYLCSND